MVFISEFCLSWIWIF